MLRSVFDRYRLWLLKRKTERILHGFDDHQLRDVGTFRDSIELFVADRAMLPSQPKRPGSPWYQNGKTRFSLDAGKQVTS